MDHSGHFDSGLQQLALVSEFPSSSLISNSYELKLASSVNSSSSSNDSSNESKETPQLKPVTLPTKRHRTSTSHNKASPNFVPRSIIKSPEDFLFLAQSLSQSFIFANLDSSSLSKVINTIYLKKFEVGSKILHKDEESSELYIVKSGKIKIDIDENIFEEFGPGKIIGEIALLHNSPQIIDVLAVEDCECWALDRETFVNMVKKTTADSRKKFYKLFHRIFRKASQEMVEDLVDGARFEVFCAGELVAKKGADSGKLLVIYEGRACSLSGEYFEYIWEKQLEENVIADSIVKCMSLPKETINTILDDEIS